MTNETFVFNALSNSQKKGRIFKYKTPLTWHVWFFLQDQKQVHPKQLDKSSLDNTCPGWGLDKPQRPTTFSLVEVTTLNIGQLLSMLRGSINSRPSYLSRLLPSTQNNLPWQWTTSFAHKLAQSLGGLCTVQGTQNTCVKLRGTRYTHLFSMSSLAQEHGCHALSSLALKLTSYL